MKKLQKALLGLLILLPAGMTLWDDFPVLPTLYAVMTLLSVLFAVACLWSREEAPAWARSGIDEKTQLRIRRATGVLFLLNAAICPVGFWVGTAVDFDRDFLLLAQMVGFPTVALLNLLCLKLSEKQRK